LAFGGGFTRIGGIFAAIETNGGFALFTCINIDCHISKFSNFFVIRKMLPSNILWKIKLTITLAKSGWLMILLEL
jgi:hypothetical protein